MTAGRTFTERDIHLFLDGEMPAEEQADFRQWLDASPEFASLLERFSADRELLRSTLAPVLDEAVPGRLAAMSRRGGVDRRIARPAVRWAAAAAIFFVGGVAGYALALSGLARNAPPVAAQASLVDLAIDAHRIYSAEKLHVVEVGADQKDHMVGWLSKRVGTQLYAPDFYARDYSLVGGRLLPSGKGVAAQIMYQNHEGERISLYVAPEDGVPDSGFKLQEEGPIKAYYWTDGGYGFAVAGAVPETVLSDVAGMAYRQFLGKPQS